MFYESIIDRASVSTNSIQVIDHFVGEGSHYVECQLQGVEGVPVTAFKLLGIFAS